MYQRYGNLPGHCQFNSLPQQPTTVEISLIRKFENCKPIGHLLSAVRDCVFGLFTSALLTSVHNPKAALH
jgi:hypothetical protein